MSNAKLTVKEVIDAFEEFGSEELELFEKRLIRLRKEKAHQPNPSEVSVPKNFPPKIQELLKKKGWNWPPDEKLKARMLKADENLCGSLQTPPEIIKEVHKYFPGRFPEEG